MNPELPQLHFSIDSGDSASIEENQDISSNSELDPVQFNTLLSKIKSTQENLILRINGYEKLNPISDTLQGKLFKARVIKSSHLVIGTNVAIKKASKQILSQQIANKDGLTYIVDEDLRKEASILKKLTFDNTFPGNYVIKYLDSFESDTHFYLVLEYIESEMNLKQFRKKAHNYMRNGKMTLREYSKVVKYLMWQLTATIRCLHSVFHCSHLDICTSNLMLKNADFIEQLNGKFKVNAGISIKLVDFGVADTWRMNDHSFICNKHAVTLDNWETLAPQVLNNSVYDARTADLWALGVVFYECMVGESIYEWIALKSNKLKEYLATNNFTKCFSSDSLSLLQHLLTIDSSNRYNARQAMEHPWFQRYYQTYQNVVAAHYS